MTFDIEKFIEDNEIQFWDTGPNTQHGWINIQCPFCDDDTNHGGFNLRTGHYNCWKCGWHNTVELIKEILGISFGQAVYIQKQYQNYSAIKKKTQIDNDIKEIKLTNKNKLRKCQRKYLEKRKFDADYITRKYDLRDGGIAGPQAYRIIFPIYFENKIVSYQGRDYTEKSWPKYKACELKKEALHHKDIVYNIDNANNECCVAVEGLFDVLRLGDGAVGTFGTSFTRKQVILLSKRFEIVYIAFDKEVQAQKKAHELGNMLAGVGVESYILDIHENDPADLSELSAKMLMKELNLWKSHK